MIDSIETDGELGAWCDGKVRLLDTIKDDKTKQENLIWNIQNQITVTPCD